VVNIVVDLLRVLLPGWHDDSMVALISDDALGPWLLVAGCCYYYRSCFPTYCLYVQAS
jgi:hypothetical protein